MMVTALAPAKINLTLGISGRREDGYHLLHTVMQTVDLYDTITVCDADHGIQLRCSGGIPADQHNTAYKAAALFLDTIGYSRGVSIDVEKRIPSQAGLAGGSADAAGVLHALNALTGANLPLEQLCRLGERIGADVPFCVHGGTVLCTGTGTVLTPLPPMPDCAMVIVKPEGGVSTPEAYRLLDNAPSLLCPDTDGVCAALHNGDLPAIACRVGNAFEAPLSLPFTAPICAALYEGGALSAALSGSGSAVFGLFSDTDAAVACADSLADRYAFSTVCRPCTGVLLTQSV